MTLHVTRLPQGQHRSYWYRLLGWPFYNSKSSIPNGSASPFGRSWSYTSWPLSSTLRRTPHNRQAHRDRYADRDRQVHPNRSVRWHCGLCCKCQVRWGPRVPWNRGVRQNRKVRQDYQALWACLANQARPASRGPRAHQGHRNRRVRQIERGPICIQTTKWPLSLRSGLYRGGQRLERQHWEGQLFELYEECHTLSISNSFLLGLILM